MNKIKKDKLFRNNNLLLQYQRLLLKIFSNNKILSISNRQQYLFQNKIKYSTRYRDYCILTGRARGVLSKWKLSRIQFKALADLGKIPGIRSSSW